MVFVGKNWVFGSVFFEDAKLREDAVIFEIALVIFHLSFPVRIFGGSVANSAFGPEFDLGIQGLNGVDDSDSIANVRTMLKILFILIYTPLGC